MPIFTHLYVNGALIGESIQVRGWEAWLVLKATDSKALNHRVRGGLHRKKEDGAIALACPNSPFTRCACALLELALLASISFLTCCYS